MMNGKLTAQIQQSALAPGGAEVVKFISGRGELVRAGLLLPFLNLHISSFSNHKIIYMSLNIFLLARSTMHRSFCVCHEETHSITQPTVCIDKVSRI